MSPITQCFLYLPLKLNNISVRLLDCKLTFCQRTQNLYNFFSSQCCLLCFPSPFRETNKFFIQATFVLTNSFLKLRLFSRIIQMLLFAARLANFLDLLANLITVFFRRKSICFFTFCMKPGRTKQHLRFAFVWVKKERQTHIVKTFLGKYLCNVFNMKKPRKDGEKPPDLQLKCSLDGGWFPPC